MTTLKITINYDTGKKTFSFTPSYVDTSTTTWTTSPLLDPATVDFTSSGQYTLQDSAGNPGTFTFDTVSVVLGASLGGSSSLQCSSSSRFDLSSIVFPAIPTGQSSVSTPYSWCQEIPSRAQPMSPVFKDPKLGLSNTTGTTAVDASPFPSCKCSG
jgi:hypothetical protein